VRTLRRPWALAFLGAVLGVAATTGAALAAFTSTTSNSGSSFTAAATFCNSPGSQTVTSSEDAFTLQDKPDDNHGTENSIFVKRDNNGNIRRAWVKFPLPALPSGCMVTSAVLRLHVSIGPGTQTLAVYRAGAAWTETGITWNTEPAAVGMAVTADSTGAGWVQWTVTNLVTALYAGSNFGFSVRDANELGPGGQKNIESREDGSNPPELTVTWG
jgi:large repetitive protein